VLRQAQSGADTSVSESTLWNTLTMIAVEIVQGFLRPANTIFMRPFLYVLHPTQPSDRFVSEYFSLQHSTFQAVSVPS
jgi:hypothetical protein